MSKIKLEVPYGIKKLAVKFAIAVMPVAGAAALTSCEKPEPVDPKEQAKKELAIQAPKVRKSIEDAKTKPNDVTNVFGTFFVEEAQAINKYPAQNLADTSEVVKHVASRFLIASPNHPNKINLNQMVLDATKYLDIYQKTK